MPDQDIIFKIKADNKEAVAAFKGISQAQKGVAESTTKTMAAFRSTNQVGNAFVGLMRDGQSLTQNFAGGIANLALGIDQMADEYERAGIKGLAFKDILKQSLTGINGWVLGINLAVTAISIFTQAQGKAKEEIDSFNTSLKSMLELTDPTKGLKFLVDEKTIKATIGVLEEEVKKFDEINKRIRSQAFATVGMGQAGQFNRNLQVALTQEQQKQLETNEKMLETFKGMKIELEARLNVAEKLRGLGLEEKQESSLTKQKEGIKVVNDLLGKQKDDIGILTVMYSKYIDMIEKVNKTNPTLKQIPTQLNPVTEPNKPKINISDKELRNYYKTIDIISTSAASAIQDTFIEMWQNIFGEANNLFEKFLQNVLAGLTKIAAEKLSESIFDTILGFINPVAGLAAGVGGAVTRATQTSGTTIINVEVGGQTVTQLVTDGYIDAKRLRKITA